MNSPARSLAASASYAWVVVLLLWPVAVLNYLDRMTLATIRSAVRADIPTIANDADFGLLMSLFLWVYAFLSPFGGFLADRFGRRRTIILSLFVWSAMTWLTGHATSFKEMAWLRALMGISEACYIPAALSLIAGFHSGATRSKAVGIHMTGLYMGQALGGLSGYIADVTSWRNAFSVFGLVGLCYSAVLLLFLRDSAGPSGALDTTAPLPAKGGLKRLIAVPGFLVLTAYFTLPGTAGWAIKSWLPTHLASAFGLKQGPAGMSATGCVTLASFVGVLVGGAIADQWAQRSIRGRIYTSALGTSLCAPALLCIGFAPNLGCALAGMLLFGFGFGFFDANNMPILCQLVDREHRATGYGIMNLAGTAGGAGITWIMGIMRDRGISLGAAFTISAAFAATAAILVLFVRPQKQANPADTKPAVLAR